MLDKQTLGILSVILTIVAYVPYFRSLLNHQTKPHLLSWIIWTIMNGIAFFAQYIKGAGAGSWMTALTAILSVVVIGFAIKTGEKNITRSDWMAFTGAFLAMFLWYLTTDPLWAIIIVSIIDILACYPTLRKSYSKPYQESALSYGLCAARSALAIFALENYSVVTILYPIAMTLSNGLLTCMLIWRRTSLAK
jgi:hypothetical protein